MVNNIFINNSKIIKEEKNGKFIFVLLENGNIIYKSKIKEIEIECTKCHKKVKLKGIRKSFYEKSYLCQSCNLSGERNPFFGKTHSQEFKDKLSKERKGIWGIGEKNPMFGIDVKTKMSPEKIEQWKKHISNATKGEKNPMFGKTVESIVGTKKWIQIKEKIHQTQLNFSKQKKKEIGKKISLAQKRLQLENPELYKKLKAKGGKASVIKQCNYQMNKLEEKVYNWLKENNIVFEYSPIMQDYDGTNYQFDFIIKGKRILIECNGTYWHADPRFFSESDQTKRKLNEIQKRKTRIDKKKREFAESHDFLLLTVWEYDINNNNFEILIKELL